MERMVLIIKNCEVEGPGLIEVLLKERGTRYEVVELNQGHDIPPVENYQAVIILGGPDSANDQNEKMENELTRIREALAAQIPLLGICLGLQTLVKATGGRVVKNPIKEIGFIDPSGRNFEVELTASGKQDPLLAGLNDILKVFHLHGETVELTKDMVLLATGKFCTNQIVKVGSNAYGIQCHFELTPELLETWLMADHDLKKLNKVELLANFGTLKDELADNGQQIIKNFVEIAGFH